MHVELLPMTRERFHELFRGFEYDACMFTDEAVFRKLCGLPYDEQAVDTVFERHSGDSDRLSFAVMLGERVIGEVVLKHIDNDHKSCELGIHLKDDSVKGLGYGTEAERLAIEYAFGVLGMNTVLADTIIKNARSRHILEKIGFTRVCEKEGFTFYKLRKENYYADSTDR
ncbi:MAG: GNAT family N-acetyltransferase [Clostridia bacterium]|nr:GNAT family N-acetyltransferase [Clostridia bacterium]